ncbi:ATP-binding protein [Nesterenkonia salmonea]|uniref:ATP-binding protein n=1 Tax=Nesterenkonia salmonea TaxID=1804987 RepID=A0A5R9BED1_9MICC|nr:ATP-binding protein [Nesterenkonia salmonea]TLP98629.1 ATP-binding protein [Nesterenkonia salmonea]
MNNWYVITGGPSSGKTTTVNMLSGLGYSTTIEHARHYIDLQHATTGQTVAEIRAKQMDFQRGVLQMQLEQEAELDPQETVFLDRALPDSLAYYRFLDLEPDSRLLQALPHVPYRKTFILDLLPLAADYARTEDTQAQQRIHELLTEVYSSLPVPVEAVPVLAPEQRTQYILDRLE